MNSYNILNRLYNDVISNKYKDAYIINQENDINQYNTFKKNKWRHALDAYSINQRTPDYEGKYTCDKRKDKPFDLSVLTFVSYSNHSGLDLLNFINKILDGDSSIFVHIDNFNIVDLRKKMFEIKKINIRNTNVDDLLLTNIRRYFHSLDEVIFTNCNIKKDCNFNNLKCNIEFDQCNIESIRVFNETKANLKFLRTNIDKIVPTTILSNLVEFPCNNYHIYKELFLKCNFPNLENFKVYKDKNFIEYSYLDQFKFLPTSAPNLENLYIQGKLSSFDFLLSMKNLLRCNIDSVFNVHSSFFADVDTKEERDKLLKRNKYEYDVQKILTNEEDKFIIGTLELNRILRLARFNKLLSYDEEELKELLKGNKNFLKEVSDGEITKFYESYYDTLIQRNTLNEQDVRLGLEDTFYQLGNFIYMDRTYKRLGYDKKIVLAKKHMYRYDGIPIIFMNRKKQIKTIEEATDFRNRYPKNENYTIEKFNNDEYKDFLKIIDSLDDEISIGSLLDWIAETTYFRPSINSFRSLGEGGKYLAGIYEKYKRLHKRSDDVIEKSKSIFDKLLKIILDNYEKFTVEEKLYIYEEIDRYDISTNRHAVSPDIYNLKELYNSDVVDSINLKTNNLYQKYMNILKMTYSQLYLGEKGYDLMIDEECVKKLKLDREKKK